MHAHSHARFAFLAAALFMLGCENDTPDPGDPDPNTVASISIEPGSLEFASLGVTTPLTAVARSAAGDPISTAVITWSKRGSGVVQVNSNGVVTSLGNGTDQVVATVGSATSEITVTVAQVPASVSIEASDELLTIALQTSTITAHAVDANERPVASVDVVLSSSNPNALPVSPAGVVTAAMAGEATITATAGPVHASVAMRAEFTGPVGAGISGAPVPCSAGMAGPFPCDNVTILGYLPISALGGGPGVALNDMWGWTDPATNREYAMVGRSDGVAFVDVTVATAPRFLGFLPITPGAHPNHWHDMKVYSDHAYIVADGAGPHGMQVFDLHELRNITVPKVFSPVTTYTNVNSAHNMVIDEASGFGYIVGASAGGTTCGGALHMVDLHNPVAPTFAGCFNDPLTGFAGTGYTHDAECVMYDGPDAAYQGHEICFGANETHVSIADVTNKSAPVALSRADYPGVSYSHQGWLTQDKRYFLTNDELDEYYGEVGLTRTLIWDVAELDDPILAGTFNGPTAASDHNHYIRGSLMFASNYQFGMRVVDVSNPLAPFQVGYIDTAPLRPDLPGFEGSWSNYPFFPSGNVIISSGEEGLFVVRVD